MTRSLDLLISQAGPGAYQAEGRLPGGGPVARHTFTYQPHPLARYQQLRALEAGALLLGDEGQEIAPLLVAEAEAEAFGRDLYGRLFDQDLGARWGALRAGAQAAGEPAYLRLRFAGDAAALGALPWEFLHDGQAFLAPDRGLLLARGLAALPDLPLPSAQTGALNLLAIVSSPLDLPDGRAFEADEELALLYEALDEPLRRGQVRLDVVDEASVEEMQRALIARDYQVVHFIGHGDVDEAQGGYLLIEDAGGNRTRLPGDRFAGLLSGRGVRLVLLTSCLTALGLLVISIVWLVVAAWVYLGVYLPGKS